MGLSQTEGRDGKTGEIPYGNSHPGGSGKGESEGRSNGEGLVGGNGGGEKVSEVDGIAEKTARKAMFETFSARQKKLRTSGEAEVYRYDDLPQKIRNQIVHIWNSSIGTFHIPDRYMGGTRPVSTGLWIEIEKAAAREFGVPHLGDDPYRNSQHRCISHFLNCSVEEALGLIEFTFRTLDITVRRLDEFQLEGSGITQTPDEAIAELNHRFRQVALGYRFENGVLIRVDSELLHAEVVRPVLRLLATEEFAGPEQEFRRAHEHYRNGRYEETLADCLKAFESTMKVICE